MDVFWAAPPVSRYVLGVSFCLPGSVSTDVSSLRTITALTLAQSLLVYGGVLSGYYVVFLPHQLFKLPPQIWRLASPFLLTGPQISFLFDLYFSMMPQCCIGVSDPDANVAGSVALWQLSGDRFSSVQPAGRFLRLPNICSFCDHGKSLV